MSLDVTFGTATASLHGSSGADIAVSFTPSSLDLSVEIADISMTGGDVRVVMGTIAAGDFTTNAIDESSSSGTSTWTWSDFTVGADDALLVGVPSGHLSATESVWHRYVPGSSGDLIITVTGADGWEAYDVVDEASPETWLILASGDTSASPQDLGVVSGGRPIFIRAVSTSGSTGSLSWSLTSVASISSLITLDARPAAVPQTPASIRAYLVGAAPGVTVTFYLAGYGPALLTTSTDSTGQVLGSSLPLPAVAAGTYTLRADIGGSTIGEASFTVVSDPPIRPTTPPSDTPPVGVVQTGVRKWVLEDPAPAGEQYLFPINPEAMDSPHAPKEITLARTVAPWGQPIMWEAAPRGHDWKFSGYTQLQSHQEALERFLALRHRFWLIDHENRAWVVAFTGIAWAPKRVSGVDWSFTYDVTAQIFKGPVTPG